MSRISSDQVAYDLGYDNPSTPWRNFDFAHAVLVQAFLCGQADYQNTCPRNSNFDRSQYDFQTCERLELFAAPESNQDGGRIK